MAKETIGYIKTFRSIVDWEWYKDGNTFRVFMHLLLNAAYKPKIENGKQINVGQIIISYHDISHDLDLTFDKVRTAIKHLISTNEITTIKIGRETLINITNYEIYQGNVPQCLPQNSQDVSHDCSHENPTIEPTKIPQSHTNINKNIKNIRNKEYIYAQNAVAFDAFWGAYPKKRGKSDAHKAFDKLNPTDELLSVMLNALDRQRKSKEWQKDGGQFIPYPSTWLNGRRWEDEEYTEVYQKETSFDVELAEKQARENPKDFGSMKNPRRNHR